MKLTVRNKTDGTTIYKCETTGNPINPDTITESDDEIAVYFKRRMDAWFDGLSDFTKGAVKAAGPGAYLICTKAKNVVDQEEEVIVEDLKPYAPQLPKDDNKSTPCFEID